MPMGNLDELTKNLDVLAIIAFIFISTILIALIHSYSEEILLTCKSIFSGFRIRKEKMYSTLAEEIESAGYKYDYKQDIFYSTMNAWQRKFGYCRLYDEASAPTGMVIDCEPIYFEYNNKRWMIGLWKGQYDMTTGGEIGIYNTDGPDLNIPGVFNGTFYYCAGDREMLSMSFTLKKNGETLFKRKGRHWWLTGFKLGEFSEPSQLSMDISIKLKDKTMLNEFVNGLKAAGYQDYDIAINKRTVSLIFDKPKNPQPITRTVATDWIIQRKNEELCALYTDIISSEQGMEDKLNAVKEQSIEAYEKMKNIGRTKPLFDEYEKVKDYLN